MEQHQVLPDTHLAAQDTASMHKPAPPIYQSGPSIQELPPALVSRLPTILSKDDIALNVLVRHDVKRVLEPAIGSNNAAECGFMPLEVDEPQELRNMMNRVNLVNTNTSDVDASFKYTKCGYPFESWEDMNKTHREYGFPGYASPFDENPIVVVDESERKDLALLERIDGLMDTKDMLNKIESELNDSVANMPPINRSSSGLNGGNSSMRL